MPDTFDRCPTCAQPWSVPCDAVKPGTEHDVLPVRCTRTTHPADYHEHPPLWPGTPAVIWPADD